MRGCDSERWEGEIVSKEPPLIRTSSVSREEKRATVYQSQNHPIQKQQSLDESFSHLMKAVHRGGIQGKLDKLVEICLLKQLVASPLSVILPKLELFIAGLLC